jgi:hypothetical protein
VLRSHDGAVEADAPDAPDSRLNGNRKAPPAAGWRRLIVPLFIAAAVIASLDLSYQTLKNEPALVEKRLPDGTAMRLEVETYGTKHHFERRRSFIARFLEKLPWTRRQGLQIAASQNTASDTLSLWFTHRGAGREILPFDWWTDAEAIDEHGFAYPAERHLMAFGPNTSHSAGLSKGERPSLTAIGFRPEYVLARVNLTSFPRRRGTFRFRFYGPSRVLVGEMEVPNPAGGPFPIWKPEPLPVTHRDGDVAMTLTGVTGRLFHGTRNDVPWESRSVEPQLTIMQGGKPSRHWTEREVRLSDSTGNNCSGSECVLAPTESAWKLHLRLWRGADARFGTEETWHAGAYPIPPRGSVQRIDRGQVVNGARLQLVALAGPGRFRYTNGVPGAIPGAGVRTLPQGSYSFGGGTTVNGATTTTTQDVEAGSWHVAIRAPQLAEAQRLSLRCEDERGRITTPRIAGSSGDLSFYLFDPAPDARRLKLSLFVHTPRQAEFLIQPPAFKPR